MRRGIGVAHVQAKKDTAKAMADAGAQLSAQRTAQLVDNIQVLETRLKELAKKHESLIRRDPLVRIKFKQLADSLGIDLLESNANMFSKALGIGEYYYDLCVKIVEICIREKPYVGDMIPLTLVLKEMKRLKPNDNIQEQDIRMALEKVRVLGSGYDLIGLGDSINNVYIRITPEDINADVMTLLRLANEKAAENPMAPILTREDLTAPPRCWNPPRADKALRDAMSAGLCWVEREELDVQEGPAPSHSHSTRGTCRERFWFVMLLPTSRTVAE
jgi:ESCRT-II complex subunit VPS22